ncbi:type VI secretion system-associated protein TagO [Vreelandella sp. GE22]
MASDNVKVIGTIVVGVFVAAWLFSDDGSDDSAATATAASQNTSASETEPAGSAPETAPEVAAEPEIEATPPSPPPPPPSPWRVRESVSQMDDSRSVYLTTQSNERIPGRFGRSPGKATLYVRCVENTTALLLQMNGNHMTSSPYHDWGDVRMRIDDNPAFTKSMTESTNNQSLGLWGGGQSIPVIRRMFDAELLTMRATPYSESPITMTFDITALKDEIAPLREACHW